MTDLSKLNDSIAKLSSALERFFGAQDPPVHAGDQPGIDAAVKQLDAIVSSIPASDAKRPFAKPEKADKGAEPKGAVAPAVDTSVNKLDPKTPGAVVFAPAEPAKTAQPAV